MSFVLRTLLTKCPSYFTWNRSKMMNRILLRFSKHMCVKCPVNMLSSATRIQNEENHVLDWAIWKPTISICSLQTFLQWLFRRILRKFPYISAYMSRTPFTALTGICPVKKSWCWYVDGDDWSFARITASVVSTSCQVGHTPRIIAGL